MHNFTSKEIYMMNGGQKHYIGKDGFWDVHSATPEEEAEWAKELVAIALSTIDTEVNTSALQVAIKNLAFQKYHDQVTVLVKSIPGTSPARQLTLATALWGMNCEESDFETVFEILLHHNSSCITYLFQEPGNFKQHTGARFFLIRCFQGNDEQLFEKAHTILSIWAWSGLPELRENNALDQLQFNNRDLAKSIAAIKRLKEILVNIK